MTDERSIEQQLRQVVAQLELVSHVNAVALDSSGGRDTSDDIGGKRPSGGVDRRDERRDGVYEVGPGEFEEMTFTLKSADHFRRRMASARTDHAMRIILDDAERALKAWRFQPKHRPDSEPDRASPLWKHWVGSCGLSDGEIARKYGVTRQYVNRIRNQYREAA